MMKHFGFLLALIIFIGLSIPILAQSNQESYLPPYANKGAFMVYNTKFQLVNSTTGKTLNYIGNITFDVLNSNERGVINFSVHYTGNLTKANDITFFFPTSSAVNNKTNTTYILNSTRATANAFISSQQPTYFPAIFPLALYKFSYTLFPGSYIFNFLNETNGIYYYNATPYTPYAFSSLPYFVLAYNKSTGVLVKVRAYSPIQADQYALLSMTLINSSEFGEYMANNINSPFIGKPLIYVYGSFTGINQLFIQYNVTSFLPNGIEIIVEAIYTQGYPVNVYVGNASYLSTGYNFPSILYFPYLIGNQSLTLLGLHWKLNGLSEILNNQTYSYFGNVSGTPYYAYYNRQGLLLAYNFTKNNGLYFKGIYDLINVQKHYLFQNSTVTTITNLTNFTQFTAVGGSTGLYSTIIIVTLIGVILNAVIFRKKLRG